MNEAAAYLALSRSTLQRLVRDKRLVAIRIGAAVRFAPKDLDEFIALKSEAARRDAGWFE